MISMRRVSQGAGYRCLMKSNRGRCREPNSRRRARADGRLGCWRHCGNAQRSPAPDEPTKPVLGVNRLFGMGVELDGRFAQALRPQVGEAHCEAMPARAGGEELLTIPTDLTDGDTIDLNCAGLPENGLAEPSMRREPYACLSHVTFPEANYGSWCPSPRSSDTTTDHQTEKSTTGAARR
jgi:hypothetical protein